MDLCTVEEDKSYAKEGDQVAIKRMKTVSDAEMAKKEALVLNKLDHQFIVRYLDNFKDNLGQLCIVMEYCDEGTLEDFLSSFPAKPHPEFNIWRMVGQFSYALSFLHRQHPPILHNDLKPANILCKTNPDSEIEIKIADFGVCNILGKIYNIPLIFYYSIVCILYLISGQTPSAMYYCASQLGGTICYLAPEVLRGDDPHISTSADMWSLGAVLTYVANDRRHLFRSERDVFRWRAIMSPIERQCKYPLDDLVLSLLSVDKHNRPTANQLLEDDSKYPERRKAFSYNADW